MVCSSFCRVFVCGLMFPRGFNIWVDNVSCGDTFREVQICGLVMCLWRYISRIHNLRVVNVSCGDKSREVIILWVGDVSGIITLLSVMLPHSCPNKI